VRQAKLLRVLPTLAEIHVRQVNLYFTLLSSRFQSLENAYEQTFVQRDIQGSAIIKKYVSLG
jgi:hypothetical protein